MQRIRIFAVVMAIVSAACSGGSAASSCAEYAGEIDDLIASGASAEELSAFIDDTEEHAARLIAADTDNAGPCVEAIMEAMFSSAFEDLESFLQE